MSAEALTVLRITLNKELERLYQQEDKCSALSQAIRILEQSEEASEGSAVRVHEEVRSSPVGKLESEPRETHSTDVSPQRPSKQADTRLPCPACGGRLEPSQRALSNGKVVNLLTCTDSGCNHEQF
jgi:hypothetical protein